jgi:hypothetical protein
MPFMVCKVSFTFSLSRCVLCSVYETVSLGVASIAVWLLRRNGGAK